MSAITDIEYLTLQSMIQGLSRRISALEGRAPAVEQPQILPKPEPLALDWSHVSKFIQALAGDLGVPYAKVNFEIDSLELKADAYGRVLLTRHQIMNALRKALLS